MEIRPNCIKFVAVMTQQEAADTRQAAEAMRRGGVILYPTDTVWGLGCDARSQEAVRRIYDIKRRQDAKALITLVADTAMLERWVDDIPGAAYRLLDVAVDPLTIIYDHPHGLAPNLLAPDGSAAIRVPRNALCQGLCRAMGGPLVSTSANVSGSPAPRSFADIPPEILEAVDYVCLTGREAKAEHRPSSIIKVSEGGLVQVIRP